MRIPGGPASRSVTYVAAAAAAFVAVLMALPEPAPPDPADGGMPEVSFAIAGVTVFDGEAFRPDQDVWVEDGRIRDVGEALDLPEALARVDGGGRTLVPGLIDGHVHSFGSTLNDALRFGVTTVLDQATHTQFAASKRPARATLARGSEADLFLRRDGRDRGRRARYAVRDVAGDAGRSGRGARVGAVAEGGGLRLDQDHL